MFVSVKEDIQYKIKQTNMPKKKNIDTADPEDKNEKYLENWCKNQKDPVLKEQIQKKLDNGSSYKSIYKEFKVSKEWCDKQKGSILNQIQNKLDNGSSYASTYQEFKTCKEWCENLEDYDLKKQIQKKLDKGSSYASTYNEFKISKDWCDKQKDSTFKIAIQTKIDKGSLSSDPFEEFKKEILHNKMEKILNHNSDAQQLIDQTNSNKQLSTRTIINHLYDAKSTNINYSNEKVEQLGKNPLMSYLKTLNKENSKSNSHLLETYNYVDKCRAIYLFILENLQKDKTLHNYFQPLIELDGKKELINYMQEQQNNEKFLTEKKELVNLTDDENKELTNFLIQYEKLMDSFISVSQQLKLSSIIKQAKTGLQTSNIETLLKSKLNFNYNNYRFHSSNRKKKPTPISKTIQLQLELLNAKSENNETFLSKKKNRPINKIQNNQLVNSDIKHENFYPKEEKENNLDRDQNSLLTDYLTFNRNENSNIPTQNGGKLENTETTDEVIFFLKDLENSINALKTNNGYLFYYQVVLALACFLHDRNDVLVLSPRPGETYSGGNSEVVINDAITIIDNADLSPTNYITFPYRCGSHFASVVINLNQSKIIFSNSSTYDEMGNHIDRNDSRGFDLLSENQLLPKLKNVLKNKTQKDFEIVNAKCPQQKDHYMCGVHAVINSLRFCNQSLTIFEQEIEVNQSGQELNDPTKYPDLITDLIESNDSQKEALQVKLITAATIWNENSSLHKGVSKSKEVYEAYHKKVINISHFEKYFNTNEALTENEKKVKQAILNCLKGKFDKNDFKSDNRGLLSQQFICSPNLELIPNIKIDENQIYNKIRNLSYGIKEDAQIKLLNDFDTALFQSEKDENFNNLLVEGKLLSIAINMSKL
jgi:hypothetical protein